MRFVVISTGATTLRADPLRPDKAPAIENFLRGWGLHRVPFAADDKSALRFPARSNPEVMDLLDITAALRG